MRLRSLPRTLLLFAASFLCASQAFAQVQPAPSPQVQPSPSQSPDVVRVSTSLVQTDVMVLDQQGKFIDGLKREQFVLKVDGKPRDITFFDRIAAGSRNEESQLAAARGGQVIGDRPDNGGAIPLDRGRTIIFFIDDMHLSAGSMKQVRVMLSHFIEGEMGQNDEASIVTASGQTGLLAQLTDDKRVLQIATDRLLAKPDYQIKDSESPPMSEYQAMQIEGHDADLFNFFVEETLRRNPGLQRGQAEHAVHGRAVPIVDRSIFVTTSLLASLKTLVTSSAVLPGRKLAFFISDGFLLDVRNADSYERLAQVTRAAAAAGVVIYSIDSRGLTASLTDASTEATFDPSGRVQRSGAGEMGASQNALNALAADTGGRAFFNKNYFSTSVTTALKETSTYYLLVWRPDSETQRNAKSRSIEVSVVGRPELSVRFRRGFGEIPPSESAATNKPVPPNTKTPNEVMRDAIQATFPKTDLPVALSLTFLEVAQSGGTLTASVRATTRSLVFEAQAAGPPAATLDIGGAVFDDKGKSVSSFNKRLIITAKSAESVASPPDSVFYNHFCLIKPGLYQVRVAAVDIKRVRVGSAVRWIEIPDLGSKTLTLSSLIVGESRPDGKAANGPLDATEPGKTPEAFRQVTLNVEHRFERASNLRFMTFIYNATGGPTDATPASPATIPPPGTVPAGASTLAGQAPDLAIQVQIFRDNEPVLTMPVHKIPVEGITDFVRLPYAAEVNLETLQPGRYVMLVTVIDRVAKASASQRFGFQID